MVKFADTQKEKDAKRLQQVTQNLWNVASANNLAALGPQYLAVSIRTSHSWKLWQSCVAWKVLSICVTKDYCRVSNSEHTAADKAQYTQVIRVFICGKEEQVCTPKSTKSSTELHLCHES